ncbi:MAG: ABC transporter permease [Spirochaetes bacterium]|nr:ABC transporter permease [Spirochaetota bacterium]
MNIVEKIEKNKTLLVMKKELYRFFSDKRMVIGALVFPGVLFYVIYAIIAPFIINISIGTAGQATVYIINPPAHIQMIFEYAEIDLVPVQENEKEAILEGIAGENGNFLIVFPEGFSEEARAFDTAAGEPAPEILLYYNSLAGSFAALYGRVLAGLNIYERSLTRKFDINRSGGGDLAARTAPEPNLLAMVLPIFFLVFIFHGAMSSTTEAITGEKERGTFATIFITSITPMELAAGKVLAIGIQSFLCGIFGALGIGLALPRFIESLGSILAIGLGQFQGLNISFSSMAQYSVADFGIMMLVLLSTSCFIVVVIAIVAIHAKTAKEAQILAAPILMFFLFLSLLNIIHNTGGSGGPKTVQHYLFPVYNSLQSISDILNQAYTPANMAITIGINIFFVAIGCIVLSRLISTEKIMII